MSESMPQYLQNLKTKLRLMMDNPGAYVAYEPRTVVALRTSLATAIAADMTLLGILARLRHRKRDGIIFRYSRTYPKGVFSGEQCLGVYQAESGQWLPNCFLSVLQK
jgi:hypothetical protein